MPIVQDRLIKLVANADALADIVDALKREMKGLDLPTAIATCNSLIARTNGAEQSALAEIGAALTHLYHIFTELEIPPEVRENIIEERTHFKTHRKANEAVASYLRYKRSAMKQMELSRKQIPEFWASEATPLAHAPVSPEDPAKVDEVPDWKPDIEKARRDLEAAGKIKPAPTYVPRRERLATAPASPSAAAVAEPTAVGQLREHKYDPSVLRTSVPSLAELNAADVVPPGEDVL